MGVWIWDEAFHLFSDTAESPWTARPGRLQLTGGAVDLVKKKKTHSKKKKEAAQAWQDVHIPHQDDLLSQSG